MSRALPASPEEEALLDEWRDLQRGASQVKREMEIETTRRLVEFEVRLRQVEAKLAILRGSDAPAGLLASRRPRDTIVATVKRRGDHEFPKAVGNVAAWAESVGVSRAAAKSWYATGKWGRPIPRTWAKYLKTKYKIPLDCWPNGITDNEKPRKKKAGETAQ
jgi:hypothetical protein